MKINAQRQENNKLELFDEKGYMAENHSNIVAFLREKEKLKAEVIKP